MKSEASATLFPTMGMLAPWRTGKYFPACTDCDPTTARYFPSTACCPQSAAVFGSFLVSQTVSSTGLPLIPSFLFSAFTAALAPSAISGVVTPAENSEISISLTGGPVGFATAVEPPLATAAVATTTVTASARPNLCVRRVRMSATPSSRLTRSPGR